MTINLDPYAGIRHLTFDFDTDPTECVAYLTIDRQAGWHYQPFGAAVSPAYDTLADLVADLPWGDTEALTLNDDTIVTIGDLRALVAGGYGG